MGLHPKRKQLIKLLVSIWIGRLTTDRWALKGPEMKVQLLPGPPYRMPVVITSKKTSLPLFVGYPSLLDSWENLVSVKHAPLC